MIPKYVMCFVEVNNLDELNMAFFSSLFFLTPPSSPLHLFRLRMEFSLKIKTTMMMILNQRKQEMRKRSRMMITWSFVVSARMEATC